MSALSEQELDAALSHVLAAPRDGAAVSMLCLRPGYNQRRFVEEITLTPEGGIPGERWSTRPWLKLDDGRPHPGIQVCILQKRILDLVWRDRENTPHPGDTFILDMDLGADNLPVGSLLQVGSAVLQVSDVFNDACVKWKARYGATSKDWINRPEYRPLRLRGILCSIEQGGTIRNGDIVEKLGMPKA